MTNTQTQKTKDKTAQREMFHNPNLADFYQKVCGRYHENKMKSERKANKKIDRVTIGLGLSALVLDSCAMLNEDVYAVRPEGFRMAYSNPAELENKTNVTQSSEGNQSIDEVTTTASKETTAEVKVPEKSNDPYCLSPMHCLVIGATLIGGLVAAYILYDPKKKSNQGGKQ